MNERINEIEWLLGVIATHPSADTKIDARKAAANLRWIAGPASTSVLTIQALR